MNKINISITQADPEFVENLITQFGDSNNIEIVCNIPDEHMDLEKRLNSYRDKESNVCDNFDEYGANDKKDLCTIVTLLMEVGVSPNLMGFLYLRDAIYLVSKDRSIMGAVMKELYGKIAESNNTEPLKIDRAIRNAITVLWNKKKKRKLEEIFSYRLYEDSKRPTNTEFIVVLSDQFMLEGNRK